MTPFILFGPRQASASATLHAPRSPGVLTVVNGSGHELAVSLAGQIVRKQ